MTLSYRWFWKSLAWAMLLTVAYLTLTPRPLQTDLPLLSWDKGQHSIVYAVLMWSFLQAWEGSHVLRWAFLLVVVGVGLEIAQGFTGVRFMEVTDMLANSLGVLIGYGVWRTPLGRVYPRIESIVSGR